MKRLKLPLEFKAYSRLCSNGAWSPEATNIYLRGSEKNFPVTEPGTLASNAVFRQAGRKIKHTSVGLLSQSLLNPTETVFTNVVRKKGARIDVQRSFVIISHVT